MSTKGYIEADYNTALLEPWQKPDGTILKAKFGADGEIEAKNIVANTKDKWIGFMADSLPIKFACFKTKTGQFSCYEYNWYRN